MPTLLSLCAKSMLCGLLLAGLFRLQGAAEWTADAYGLGAAGVSPRDLCPVLPDDGRTTFEVVNALQAASQGHQTALCEHLARAVLISPDEPALRLALGVQLAKVGEVLGAMTQLERGRTLAPGNPLIWYELASVYAAAGQHDASIEAVRQALRLRPLWAAGHLRLGLLELQAGFEEVGYEQLQVAVNCPTVPAPVYLDLAGYYLQNDAPRQAIPYLEEALRIQPGYSYAANDLGNAYKALKQAVQARVWYRMAIAMDPQNPNPHNGLGVLAQAEGDSERALASYHEASKRAPHYFDARYNAGVLLLSLGRADEAAHELELACMLAPTRALPHYQLAAAQLAAGHVEAARASYSVAADLDPTASEAKELSRRLERALHAGKAPKADE